LRLYVAVTELAWYNHLRQLQPAEASFWLAGDTRNFLALDPGELFLLKLHSPHNCIVGGGVFARQLFLPVSFLWEAFGEWNGEPDFASFLQRVQRQRRGTGQVEPDPEISSLILGDPFFFEEQDWIPVPENWSPNTPHGRIYDTDNRDGKELYAAVRQRLLARKLRKRTWFRRFQAAQLTPADTGPGTFKVNVLQAYHFRCAITNASAPAALAVTYVKPPAQGGPNTVSNGLVLRRDLCTLFQRGYIALDDEGRIQISDQLRAGAGGDAGGGYASFRGQPLHNLPDSLLERPAQELVRWHRENVFLG
jgi:putative restriction endonuclease